MRIAVIGAGAIGALVAGYLKIKGEEVSLIARPQAIKAIQKNGLEISGVRGEFDIPIPVSDRLDYRPNLLILATKTQDIDEALRQNLKFIPTLDILTTQNGVQADAIVAKYARQDKIISSIVMFGATYLGPDKFMHNFEGSWIMGKPFAANDEKVVQISEVLNKIFPVVVSDKIRGMKYLKIFVNANNCIPAILGLSMREAFSESDTSRISIAIWKEGLNVMQKAGIGLVSLPDFPLERLMKLTSIPIVEGAKIFSGIMQGLSKEPLYGSILQSIKRGKLSEIDYINGEFVSIAGKNGISAPLNKKLVEMVHLVEKTHKFFNKKELISEVEGLMNI